MIPNLRLSFCLLFFIAPFFLAAQFVNASFRLGAPNITSGAPIGVVDMNNDGRDDLVRLDNTDQLVIEYQQANGNFIAQPQFSVGTAWSLCVGDIQNDGYLDIFAGGAYNGLKLIQGTANGFAFSAVPGTVFLQGSNMIDINGDNNLDIFACHDEGLSLPIINNGVGSLSPNFSILNPSSTVPSDNSGNYASIWTDYDNDGDMDLYISKCRLGVTNPNDGRRLNLMFRNDNGSYTEVAAQIGLQPRGQSWSTDFADIDNDGDMDAFIINHDLTYRLYENNGNGQFTDISVQAGFGGVNGAGMQCFFRDFDNDGWVDLLITETFGGTQSLWMNNANQTFTQLSNPFPTPLNIHSAAVGDLDNDGDIDVLASFGSSYNAPGNTPDALYLNAMSSNNNWSKVRLESTTSPANGIGARITMYTNGQQQIREVRSGEGYGVMNSLIKHFGLAQASFIDSLKVSWPSGIIDKFENLAANELITIAEGSSCVATAAFSQNVSGFTVSFTDESPGNVTSWNWDFGDGFSSNLQNPTHTFLSSGVYVVCLTITSDCGTDQVCQTVNLSCGEPTAAFGTNQGNLTINFSDLSFGDPQSWSWDFGDGESSNDQNPSHTYQQPGEYQVCLTVTNDCETNTSCTLLTVNCTDVTASFTEQISGLTILLTGSADPLADTYFWTFGDGASSQGQFLNHTYQQAGTYQVCLTVNGPCGQDVHCEDISVACAAANATFGVNQNELSVDFTGNQEAGITHFWNFADQGNATTANPSFTFSMPGSYQVCYTATNDCGSNTSCQTIQVACALPPANFLANGSQLDYNFTGPALPQAGTYTWTFGDGNSSSAPNPQHSYANSGTYQVCLTTQTICGSNTSCQNVVVSCPTPSTAFSNSLTDLTLNLSANANDSDTYDWTFGDGNTGQGQNIAHPYAQAGSYQVCLTVSNDCGSSTNCQLIQVSCGLPAAGFTFAEDNYEYQFFGPMPSLDAGFSWTFGDGGTSEEQTPMHDYASTGTYLVCLSVTTICGTNQSCQNVVVSCPPPSAAFDSTVDDLSVGLSAQNTASDTYNWTFGDGNTATGVTTNHDYAMPGQYEVCLNVIDECGSTSTCQMVTVSCGPTPATFVFDDDNLEIAFTNLMPGVPTTFSWDFGDNTTALGENPTHTYDEAGVYEVCLTTSSSCGSEQLCQQLNVTCPAPGADFSFSQDGLNVTLNAATESADSLHWTLGDGGVQNGDLAGYSYLEPGTYTICLIASNECGQNIDCQNITVACGPASAGFLTATDELTLNFTDISLNGANQWNWNFGDGNTSDAQNPSHTFAAPGTYTVCLTVNGICEQATQCETYTVNCAAPDAVFGVSSNELAVQFSSPLDSSITTWDWDFGDGTTSDLANPQHTYTNAGNYEVCLTVSSVCGTSEQCGLIMVSCPATVSQFNHQTTNLTTFFLDQSTNIPDTWTWDFGDGNSSTLENPEHTYEHDGTYTVCLTTTNNCGTDTHCEAVTIVCPQPASNFSYTGNLLDYQFTGITDLTGISFSWDFGDGTTSSLVSPDHSFPEAGNYEVCLTQTNNCGTSTLCETVPVACPVPTAAFAIENAGVTYTFSADSDTEGVDYSWDFGTGAGSMDSVAVYAFPEEGDFEVCLTISNECGASTTCEMVSVSCTAPIAGFGISDNGFTHLFTDVSANFPTDWFWEFGDGNTSTQQNPVHTYDQQGAYTVCLTVSSFCGSDQLCDLIAIQVDAASEVTPPGITAGLAPNPAESFTYLSLEGARPQAALLSWYSAAGQRMRQEPLQLIGHQYQVFLALDDFPAGLYFLRLRLEEGWVVRKVVVR